MKTITIKSIDIQNFKGCRSRHIQFKDKTTISGQNASGKTTVADAFMWCMFNKDSAGNTTFGIRPVDETGREIDNVEISVDILLDVDGVPVTFKKVQKQKWTKHRGSTAQTYEGNVNSYEHNGFPVSEKEYKAKISEIILEDDFKLTSDLRYFSNLKWQDKKELLLRLCGDVTDEDVINADPDKWMPIADDVRIAGVEKSRQKAKKELTELNKRQKEIPGRIDELRMHIEEPRDTAPLEVQLSDLSQLIEIDEKTISELKKQADTSELERQRKNISVQMSDMLDEVNRDIRRKRNAISEEKMTVSYEINNMSVQLRHIEAQMKAVANAIDYSKSRIDGLVKSYNEVAERKFAYKTTVCKSCGQILPKDRVNALKESFESEKKADLFAIDKEGKAVKFELDSKRKELADLATKKGEIEGSLIALEKRQKAAEDGLNNLPNEVSDLSGNAEYEALKTSLTDVEEALEKVSEKQKELEAVTDRFHSNRFDARRLEVEIANIQAQNNASANLKDRIAELEEEQRTIGQKIALSEQKLILLEQFSIRKSELLSKKVTDQFELAKFSLFSQQINGALIEQCEITLKGVKYRDMNSGHKIICALDIIRTFQNKLGISAPVFIDNSETINSFNLPQMDCQVILLKVTDDKELVVA